MKRKSIRVTVFVGAFLSVLVALVIAAQDKYTLRVPNGLAFSEFKGYENWQDCTTCVPVRNLAACPPEFIHDA